MKREPIAILCSDLHLSLKSPACRKDEDWMAVQRHYLDQVTDMSFALAEKSSWYLGKYLPVIVAGDIFDRWNPAPELLHFAIQHLPQNIYAVPGQHDLPNHRQDQMHRSGYGVLVAAERIHNLSSYVDAGNRFSMNGFGWGNPVKPLDDSFKKLDPKEGKCVHIAVVHKYIWDTGSNSYVGAKKDDHISSFREALLGYDVAAFGDNHKGFSTTIKSGTRIFNCGGFMRRKADELDYSPMVGIVYNDGSITIKKLDTSIDRFRDPKEMSQVLEVDLGEFVDQLEKLGEHGLDFRGAVREVAESLDIPVEVRDMVLRCIE